MAATHWRTDTSVADLYHKPDVGWSFEQLIRLLLESGVAEADLPDTLNRRIRFNASLKTDFPPSEIRQINVDQQDEDGEPTVEVTCVSDNVAGLNGPIPEPFFELAREDEISGEGAFAAFFNLFNQQLQVTRYLVNTVNRLGVTTSGVVDTTFGQFLLALSGNFPVKPLNYRDYDRQRKQDIQQKHQQVLTCLSALLANNRMSLPVIRQSLQTRFGLTLIEMNSFVERWLPVDEQDRTLLGDKNQRLGESAVLGHRIWDQQAAIELKIGPVSMETLRAFTPGGPRFYELKTFMQWICERRSDCRITFVIEEENIQRIRLTRREKNGARLGLTSWLHDVALEQQEVSFMLYIVEADTDTEGASWHVEN